MASNHHNNHRQHRPHRLSLPPRTTTTTTTTAPITPSRHYPPFTPTPTPSKHRRPPPPSATAKFSPSSLFLLLFSLRSLYSLLPFLQSSPSSFTILPFSFLVSLLSFLLSLLFSIFSPKINPNPNFKPKSKSIFAFHHSITKFQQRILFLKSILLAIVFLLRFQALRYCGTAAMIMAETSGHVASNFVSVSGRNRSLIHLDRVDSKKYRGFFALFVGIFLLSIGWDRIECFPFSFVNFGKLGFANVLIMNSEKCVRVWPMVLPFLSGFLGGYEQLSVNNWGTIRDLGRKEVRLISLFYTTVLLFIPATVSMLVFEAEGDSVSIGNLGWPLANTVVFGVLLSESYTDEKKPTAGSKDFRKEFLVTFVCTVVLELLYYPELSLWGLLICGMLLGIGVMELDPVRSNSLELGHETPDSFLVSVTKVVRHIVGDRKSRKIAVFLLINTGYMVVEFVAGFMSNSLGLISDACHMLFDCAALGIGLYASYIARLPANGRYNYGRGRFEVLSGYTNAVFLVLVGALIVLESLERILEPQEISTSSLLTVSIGGLAVNVVGLIFFHDEHHHAHGGGVACSHSHSHSSRDGHSHVNVGDGVGIGGKHQEGDLHSHVYGGGGLEIVGKYQEDHRHSHVNVGGGHEFGGKYQEDHLHSHVNVGNKHQENESIVSSTSHCHDHHHHGHHDHNHDHGHHHDHHDHGHHHDGHDHGHHHDHDGHDHGHHHDHDGHDHGHHHDHHDHEHHHDHDCHDHGHHHDHHDHVPMEDNKQNHHNHHHHIDHNMEGIFLHVLADTLGSVGVVVSTLLIQYKGWLIADPACSIFISLLIVSSVIPLLRNSAEVLLQRVPRAHEHDLKAAVTSIMKIKGISGIHNFHVWSLANNDTVGTLHLYVSSETDKVSARKRVSDILRDAGVKDLTLQVEICR